jgi:hypothetical protein
MIGTIVGLKSIERDSIFLLRSMGATSRQAFCHERLPNGRPQIFAGMQVAIVLASVGAIVGEFVGANEELGYVLLTANGTVDTQLRSQPCGSFRSCRPPRTGGACRREPVHPLACLGCGTTLPWRRCSPPGGQALKSGS